MVRLRYGAGRTSILPRFPVVPYRSCAPDELGELNLRSCWAIIPARGRFDSRSRLSRTVILGLDRIGAKLTADLPSHSSLHRHPRARPGDQSTHDVVKMIPGSGPGMTVQGAHAYFSAYGARPEDRLIQNLCQTW